MRGARRRPYVDMVKEGNDAADRPGRNPGGDGAIRAHLFVGSPRNIDILLRALLLDLPPASPPSHTCLVMKQVLSRWNQPLIHGIGERLGPRSLGFCACRRHAPQGVADVVRD